jgi:hypothetical protein
MENLLACPSPPRREVKWNIIQGGGHFIWPDIYDGSAGFDIYGFLLQNAKPLEPFLCGSGEAVGGRRQERPAASHPGEPRAGARRAGPGGSASAGPRVGTPGRFTGSDGTGALAPAVRPRPRRTNRWGRARPPCSPASTSPRWCSSRRRTPGRCCRKPPPSRRRSPGTGRCGSPPGCPPRCR